MEALAEILQAGTAYILVRRDKRSSRDLSPELTNFQFYSTQCGFFGDTPRGLLDIAVQAVFLFYFGYATWWIGVPVGYVVSKAVPFLYSLVQSSVIYFHGGTTEGIRLDGSEVDDLAANRGQEEAQDQLENNERFSQHEMFQHRPLSGPDDFRCLLLKSSKDKDAVIECELYHLGVDNPAFYDAVSYCWEGQTPTEPIICDNQRFLVTANCMEILKHLRRRWVGRLLWVDAICIDQTREREQERNQQLQIMGQIYQRAAKVIIWLGPSTPEGRLAFRYLRFLQEMMILPQRAQDWLKKRLLDKIVARKHENYIREISRRPWYSRVWTVQEVAMAKQGCCIVYCGDDKLNYDWMNIHLFGMTTYLHARDDYGLNDLLQEPRKFLRSSLRHMVASKAAADGQFPPIGIPYLMRFLLCYHSTHPADKIFAFYGVLKEIGVYMPPPDYGVSLGAVYWTATLALLRHEQSTSLLPLASGVDGRLGNVPSWVPDFRVSSHVMFVDGTFSASGSSVPRVEIVNRWRFLKVSGKIIDTIIDRSNERLEVWEPPFGVTDVMDSRYFGLDDVHKFTPTILVLQDFISFSLAETTNLRYRDDGKNVHHILGNIYTQGRMAFLALTDYDLTVWLGILMANQPWFPHAEGESLEIFLQQAREDPEMRRRFFDDPEMRECTQLEQWQILCAMKMSPCAARMMHLVWAMARGNMLFSTRERYLGSASRSLVVGDEIALIQGVNTPMVLRPVETQGGKRYKVVGPAYVYGVMNGELWNEGSGVEDLMLI